MARPLPLKRNSDEVDTWLFWHAISFCPYFIHRFVVYLGPPLQKKAWVPEGFVRTNEVSIDPTTKKKLVVYFNSDTGERFYKEE